MTPGPRVHSGRILPDEIAPGMLSLNHARRYMNLAYVASLGVIAVLSIVVHLLLDRVIEEQGETGWTVNRSGEQRMLSQRATLFTLEYLRSAATSDRELAEAALARLEANAAALLAGHQTALATASPSPLSTELQRLYFDPQTGAITMLDRFINSARRQLDAGDAPRASTDYVFFQLAREPLLQRLDQIVSVYEREGEARVAQLRLVQRIVLAIILLTLALEGLFIFRPMVAYISALNLQLERAAHHDALSELANRRSFSLLGTQQVGIARRYEQPLSLLLLDIDLFKHINDSCGHEVGDQVIRQVASAMQTSTRAADVVARIGGEEFAVLAPDTAIGDAVAMAEKLREHIAALSIDASSAPPGVTVSIGVATLSADDADLTGLMRRADEALYQAKREGRNRVVSAGQQAAREDGVDTGNEALA